MKEENRHIIWSNYNLTEMVKELKQEYPGITDEHLYPLAERINNEYLEDERYNLNITLARPIIIIADLGLWDGRKTGYKEITSGNIKDCFYSDTDYSTWYVDDNGDMWCDAIHHDGTNHYRYRVYKAEATEDEIEDLKEKIYNGTVTEEDIVAVTLPIGKHIAKVYGW